jgi:hypothetical protein
MTVTNSFGIVLAVSGILSYQIPLAVAEHSHHHSKGHGFESRHRERKMAKTMISYQN